MASPSTPITTSISSVRSADGTKISYRRLGSTRQNQPGLIIIPGSFETSASHVELAELLAQHNLTIYLPDRRGRGLSSRSPAATAPFPDKSTYSIATEVADLRALLVHTGARYVLGISSGALIALQAAVKLGQQNATGGYEGGPLIQKAAIFEPPLFVDGVDARRKDLILQCEQKMDEGDAAGALVIGMLAAEMGPPWMRKLPRSFLEGFTKFVMWMQGDQEDDKEKTKGDTKEQEGDGNDDREISAKPEPTMKMMAPTLWYDFQLVQEMAGRHVLERMKSISTETLLLVTEKSPPYLRTAIQELAKVVPSARRLEWMGLHHGATGNRNRGGSPQVVAQDLVDFFSNRAERE